MEKIKFNHPVLDYFYEISQIPRGSGNEQQISDWLVQFAEDHHLEVHRDEAKNVLIRKPASIGYKSAPSVLLQAHMDMVCEKNPEVNHDFTKDPIEFVIHENDVIYGKGTTLGADNGIGLSEILAVLTDDNVIHPDLECLITTKEEIGMIGCKSIDARMFNIQSKVMINLDAGGEGVFIAGCCGGGTMIMHLPIEWNEIDSTPVWRINITGLLGGHSGAEIHLQRASATQIAGRILNEIHEYRICAIKGGTKDNAIARMAEIEITCNDAAVLQSKCEKWQKELREEYRLEDPNIVISAEDTGRRTSLVYSEVTQEKAAEILNLTPQGVCFMNLELDRVNTSSNLGIISSDDHEILFRNNSRSSLKTQMYNYLVPKFEDIAKLTGASLEKKDFYPCWAYNPKSKICQMALESYQEVGGTAQPVATIIHGGLECGILMGLLGEMDIVAFAPDISECHCTREHVVISSVKTYYHVLLKLLEKMNQY